jgi:methyl-accepting chemotaxis protein
MARAVASRFESVTLLLVLSVAAAFLGLGFATAFLVGFARLTVADARTLSSYGAKMARGDYPDDKLPARDDALGEIGAVLRKLTRLEKAIYDVRDLGASLQGSTRNLDAQVTGIASRIAAQTSRIESAVTMLDDIVQAIGSVYTNARRSLETAEESGREIDGSIQELLEGAAEVAQLGNLTNRIGEIVSLISSIADQTDILSLNAGIEAARAGPYGRGFTVVAAEVRKLADKSGRSALEISELTQSILSVVQRIAARTDEESFVMSSIQKGLARIKEAVGQVTEVSAAASDNVVRLSTAIDEITGTVMDSQRESGEIVKTARGLRSDVEFLRGLGSELGFSVSTASFAEWSAEEVKAPEAPPPPAAPLVPTPGQSAVGAAPTAPLGPPGAADEPAEEAFAEEVVQEGSPADQPIAADERPTEGTAPAPSAADDGGVGELEAVD